MRSKYNSQHIEKMAETAAAIWSLGNEFMAQCAVPKEMVEREWFEAWAQGADHIDMEVQAALLDKADSFEVAQHIPSLKRLVDAHILSAPVSRSSVQQESIEADNFNLMMKKADYDVTAYQAWQKKLANQLRIMLAVSSAWRSGCGMRTALSCFCIRLSSCWYGTLRPST